jgi:hypothetical protein
MSLFVRGKGRIPKERIPCKQAEKEKNKDSQADSPRHHLLSSGVFLDYHNTMGLTERNFDSGSLSLPVHPEANDNDTTPFIPLNKGGIEHRRHFLPTVPGGTRLY